MLSKVSDKMLPIRSCLGKRYPHVFLTQKARLRWPCTDRQTPNSTLWGQKPDLVRTKRVTKILGLSLVNLFCLEPDWRFTSTVLPDVFAVVKVELSQFNFFYWRDYAIWCHKSRILIIWSPSIKGSTWSN